MIISVKRKERAQLELGEVDDDVNVCLVWLLTKNFLGKPDGTFRALLLCDAFIGFFRVCSLMSLRGRRGVGVKRNSSQVSSFRWEGKKAYLLGKKISRALLCSLFLSLLSGDNLIPFSWISWPMCASWSGWSFPLEQHSKWKELEWAFSMV